MSSSSRRTVERARGNRFLYLDQLHPVLVRPLRNDDARPEPQPVPLDRPIVNVMLPATPLAGNLRHVRMLLLQRAGHFEAAVNAVGPLVQLVGIAAAPQHRRCLLRKKTVEQDRVVTVLEQAEAQVSVLVVAPAPPVRNAVAQKDARVNAV